MMKSSFIKPPSTSPSWFISWASNGCNRAVPTPCDATFPRAAFPEDLFFAVDCFACPYRQHPSTNTAVAAIVTNIKACAERRTMMDRLLERRIPETRACAPRDCVFGRKLPLCDKCEDRILAGPDKRDMQPALRLHLNGIPVQGFHLCGHGTSSLVINALCANIRARHCTPSMHIVWWMTLSHME